QQRIFHEHFLIRRIDRLREVTVAFERGRHRYKTRVLRRDLVRLLVGVKEKCFVFQPEFAAFAETRQPHWTTEVTAGIKVTIKRSLQARFVVEEWSGVERLVAQEVVDRTGEVFAAAFRDD